MVFVHGHARATGWVMAHRRAPNRDEEGQLALIPSLAELIPRQRGSPPAERSTRKRARPKVSVGAPAAADPPP